MFVQILRNWPAARPRVRTSGRRVRSQRLEHRARIPADRPALPQQAGRALANLCITLPSEPRRQQRPFDNPAHRGGTPVARCVHGSEIYTIRGADVCAHVGLEIDGSSHGCLQQVQDKNGGTLHLEAGSCVEWRYITSDNNWVMVEIRGRSNTLASWVFLPRNAINPHSYSLPNILTRGRAQCPS